MNKPDLSLLASPSQPDMCGLTVECSYTDHVIIQLVIHGMRDSNIGKNINGELTDLAKLVNLHPHGGGR